MPSLEYSNTGPAIGLSCYPRVDGSSINFLALLLAHLVEAVPVKLLRLVLGLGVPVFVSRDGFSQRKLQMTARTDKMAKVMEYATSFASSR